jgi:hypothetical protein
MLFKANILEIADKKMKLHIGLYRSSYSRELKEGNFLKFVDERTITCFLSGRDWVLGKTIEIDDH